MAVINHLEGIGTSRVRTSRLEQFVLTSGPEDGVPVLLVHGNASNSTFWEEVMLALPPRYRAIAPDLRGYGETEDKLIDATRGSADWVDDLLALTEALGIERYPVAGPLASGSDLS